MSMSIVLVRVGPAAYAALQRAPEHLQVILDDEKFAPELGVADDDIYPDVNYLGAVRFCEERGLDREAGDPVLSDLGVDGVLDYEATYGPAFSISPASAGRACASSLLLADADDLRAWVATAAERGAYIVGVII